MPAFRYKILAARVIDGDTVDFTIDLGFHMSFRASCRLAHINAPEGKQSAASKWLTERLSRDAARFEIETSKPDKYGRWLVEIFEQDDGGLIISSLNRQMLDLGLAVPYEGGKR